ncbi:flavin reductase family protein [Candidatus Hodarchaeum mangrovi]
MNEIIFACLVDFRYFNLESILFATSIREFGGKLANTPIWMFFDSTESSPKSVTENKLNDLRVQLFPYTHEPNQERFPFLNWVFTASLAETKAKSKTKNLAWLSPETLILNEPFDLILQADKKLGFRPVHHTLIGSVITEEVDPYWKTIYNLCQVDATKIFPMRTHIDGKTIRPYFNAGCLVVNPNHGILNLWFEKFKEIFPRPEMKEFYKHNELYAIFTHQAILVGTVISKYDLDEIQELPFTYNYPLHLYHEAREELRPSSIKDLTTIRYENLAVLKNSEFAKPIIEWVNNQLDILNPDISQFGKYSLGPKPLIFPIPISLVGALVAGKPNFETIGDVGIMGLNPPLVYVSSHKEHYTNHGILRNQTFSINLPPTSLLPQTDYCGVVSGKDVDKSQLFTVFYGKLHNAPMIAEASVNLECKVIKEFSIQNRQIFIGEVVQSYIDERLLEKKGDEFKIKDMINIDPIIYGLNNRYYSIGKEIGVGYHEYKKFKPD